MCVWINLSKDVGVAGFFPPIMSSCPPVYRTMCRRILSNCSGVIQNGWQQVWVVHAEAGEITRQIRQESHEVRPVLQRHWADVTCVYMCVCVRVCVCVRTCVCRNTHSERRRWQGTWASSYRM